MKRYELIVIGAGPAGLSAAIEAASWGMKVIVFDENVRPGGQLFKQIHKFFGSKKHKAKIRGFRIGDTLLKEAEQAGVTVQLKATVMGVFNNKEITVMMNDQIEHFKGDNILIATGASENMITFPGWTLPGVIGAGAAQTLMNLHGVKPGSKILMVGSGNVGLVVSFQLLQAGCEVVAIIDASSRIGGYGVHAAKVARTGVPYYLSHTIIQAEGEDCVTGAVIGEVDDHWQIIEGTQKKLDVDTICLAVGLSPMSQLARMAGCEMIDEAVKGGLVPLCSEYGETSIPGLFCAGDVAGIEEASSAMIQGRIAGSVAARRAGYILDQEFAQKNADFQESLAQLREGMFGAEKKGKNLSHTDEGIPLSLTLLQEGYINEAEIQRFPGFSETISSETKTKGVYPVIECTQNIPCNPCQDACQQGCISIGDRITSLPIVTDKEKCSGCGMCVSSCPGQAIFLIEENYEEDYVAISLPYEFLPLPQPGEQGLALDRSGQAVGSAEIVKVRQGKAMDETAIVTMKVRAKYAASARFYQQLEGCLSGGSTEALAMKGGELE
ncbi:FAD-dependent oxidoreductase [Desulfosporosinus sp. OT]|uniref:FAD-dependent oxidoreductase n=1 Tax=Desulfosporosinus sp. OT TaxID=913865 RepID=UPI000223ACF4|nr:FAD-dependent oxidoreductase [Desulfosporosinus sp. OT]EGW41774.1 pyridine nucleotide-disulfide oxidoreductase family protein [Desulfosporosinus sp. OT]